jgi:thioesterase domain-containing protein
MKVEPEDPHAISGYSLGPILAFEVSKKLEAQGQEVKFRCAMNYCPYVKHHLQDLDAMLHIAIFLGPVTPDKIIEQTSSILPSSTPRSRSANFVDWK